MFIELTLAYTKDSMWFNVEHIQRLYLRDNNNTGIKETGNPEEWEVIETPTQIMKLIDGA